MSNSLERPEATDRPRLQCIFDDTDAPALPLSNRLQELYDGELRLASSSVYGNFVSSVDGVVSLGVEDRNSGSTISGHNPEDRFLMGLLRAAADAVVVGAGTLRATPGHRWTPEQVFGGAAAEFAALRTSMHRSTAPRLVVVTARGDVDAGHPAFADDALVITTDAGAARLRGRLPGTVEVQSLGDSAHVPGAAIVAAVRAHGCNAILTEGGPLLMGHLLRAGVVDELFLTLSPILAGRAPQSVRPGLVDGVEFAAQRFPRMTLLSARRAGNLLFLRYRIGAES